MSMLKQIAEILPEIDEDGLPDYDNDPGFLKWLDENPEEKEKWLEEKEELSRRNHNGTWLKSDQHDKIARN